jgi:hypothetical protein
LPGLVVRVWGAVELRVKETRRGKWASASSGAGDTDLRSSGGEDPLGTAREAERLRARYAYISGFWRGESHHHV